MTRGVFGLLLVLAAAAAHFGLIYAGVYRKYPIEWWGAALVGVLLALGAFRTRRVLPRVLAVVTVLLAVVFVLSTTVVTRIARPDLTIVPGQKLAAFTVTSDDGSALAFPRAGGLRRATLLVLFRGVW
jgi:hypothetical protein